MALQKRLSIYVPSREPKYTQSHPLSNTSLYRILKIVYQRVETLTSYAALGEAERELGRARQQIVQPVVQYGESASEIE